MKATAHPAVQVRQLTITYDSSTAVADVSFEIPAGTVLGLIGPNGSGKTSIVESVAGLRRTARHSNISVCGYDPQRDRNAVSRLVGMQLQESQFPSRATVKELCDLYEAIYSAPGTAARLLETVGLAGRRRSLISSLSGGMRQRLALALAQIGDVRVVILDELTTGLDPEQRRATWQAVRDLAARGIAVLLTSHHMDEVETLCDQVGVLLKGELVALDSPARITAVHGGPSKLSINLADTPPGIAQQMHALGLQLIPGASEHQLQYAGNYPDDYNRIIRHLTSAGLPPSALHHQAPTLEDAYLRLINASSSKGGQSR